ncbi:ATP-binding cassette domain-containing protein [Mesoaciditoga lauensis]|uniref:ATP-binding cassette domain-containing protein n=1 Tax=Mesoaciditoga lauensis TaxID=1495039 RepID=UPI00056992C4|nr:ABC transporter ATP-binding protein [Mesoaciditoga lauensis]
MEKLRWLIQNTPKTVLLRVFLSFLFFFSAEIGILVVPLIYAKILNEVEISRYFSLSQFALWGSLILLFVFIKNLSVFRNALQKFVIYKTLVENTAKHVIKQDISAISTNGTQYYIDAVLNKTSDISSLLDIESMTGIVNLFRLIVLTTLFFLLDWIIGIVSVGVIISSLLIYKYGNDYYLKNNAYFVEKSRKYLSDVEDTLNGKEEIENFRAFEYEKTRNKEITKILKEIHVKFLAKDFIHFFIELDYIRIFFELFVLTFALFRAYEGFYQIGTAIVLISYSAMFTTPIAYLNSILSNIKNSITSMDIVASLFRSSEKKTLNMPNEKIKTVEFKNVTYTNRKKEIIKDLNFSLLENEKLAIIGPSGKGKSTIVSLLLKDFKCEKGEILINSKNVKNIPTDWIYSHVGVLSQNSCLFPISVKENIKIGNSSIEDEKIIEILKLMKLEDIDVNRIVEGNGKNFSGGEISRLLLARVIASEKEFLILDEPLNGVDSLTKQQIIENLKEMLKLKTVIVISHDIELATALATKKIFV